MRRALAYIFVSALLLSGCLVNDLPYPLVVPNVTSMVVEGAEKVEIDYAKKLITVHVPETTDLRKVVVQSVELDHELAKASIELVGTHDLTTPLKFNLRVYEDFAWTMKAVRHVERRFKVMGQVGSTMIDEHNCRAVAMVAEGTDLSDITVTDLKLGPADLTTYSIPMDQMKDFTDGLSVEVTAFDVTEKWTLFVIGSEVSLEVSSVNPWATKAYVTALGVAGNEMRFQYRAVSQTDWTEVAPEDITSDGGTFVAYLSALQPTTDYEVVVISGSEQSSPVQFTTDADTPIPNGSFEYVSLVKGSNYYKFYDPDCGVEEGQTMFWGSGNGEGSEGVNGSANMGIIITAVDKDYKVDGNQSVCAQTSQMAGILAAGNLFTGQFAGLVGTEGGKVNFGRPWTTRPTALKLYCRYTTSKIDIIGGMPPGTSLTKEDTDRAQIKFAIGNWEYRKYGGTADSPVHVNTTDPSTFVDFRTDPSTIADGDLIIHKDGYILNGAEKVDSTPWEWSEYTIPLNYHTMDQIPTHIIISCAASQYGDYFTGCSSSKLWIDAVELIY